jgi:hypothetical protein
MVGYLVTIVNKGVVSALEGIVRSHFTLEHILSKNGINLVQLVEDPDMTSHFFSNLYSEGKS